jgi:hypothetical protein
MATLRLPPALGLAWLLAALGAPRLAAAQTPAPMASSPFAAPVAPIPQLAPPIPHLVPVPVPLPAPLPPPRRFSPPPTIWYGWEPLAAGSSLYLLSMAAVKSDPRTGLLLGAMLSPLTTMTMHIIHGEEVKGYLSLPLSYAIIAGGGVLFEKLECGPGSARSCSSDALFNGMILGGLAALVVDAVALSWGPPAFPPPAPVKKAALWPSITPVTSGATLGVGGMF